MIDEFALNNLPPISLAAAQEYEYYGSTLTTNTALKITLLVMAAVIAVMSLCVTRVTYTAAHVKPLITRVDEVGRAEAVAYQNFTYKPQAAEIRYFLTQFVNGYYSRNRKTVAQQYVNSMYFLDSSLFSSLDARDRRTQWLPRFLISTDDDIDVAVNNVVIEDLQTEPYRARVEFTKPSILRAEVRINARTGPVSSSFGSTPILRTSWLFTIRAD